ncbi:uncharacterized protein LOC127079423 [Lathyrus oleraceus]|uniref:uncharacterized protein LOC127079423 n=1 Tax=Pisum sativum TaxID=3888 RepID=UPI0021D05D74|nr:uncharacterized protein LOC127079423 [Pisum sativum]
MDPTEQMWMFVNGLNIKTKQLIDIAAGGSTNFSKATGIKKIIEVIAAIEHLELYDRCQSKLEGVIYLNLETNKIRIEDTIATEVEKKLKAVNILDLEIKENEALGEELVALKPVVKETFTEPKPVIKLPFPTRNKKKGQHDKKFEKFLELFKKLEINIPLLEALEQMPTYAKFMKDIISKKCAIDTNPIILTETCSAILQGASVSLMPLSFYKKLGIRVVQDTRMTLQFANHSVKKPYGIVEDVLVKIDKFGFPVNLVILAMPEYEEIPLILGRPFLETGRCLINIKEGTMTLKVYEEELKIDVRNTMKYKDDICTSHTIEDLDQVMTYDSLLNAP